VPDSAHHFVINFVEDATRGNATEALEDFVSAGLVVNVLYVQPENIYPHL